MKRVMVIGAPGSGKSTLARKLGAVTGLPVTHIDHIHWMSGWQERPLPEKIAMIRPIEEGQEWIIEGGLSATFSTRLKRADTLIWLDVPIGVRFWRVVKRTAVGYGRTRPDLPAGCPEIIGWHTWEFWLYIWRTRRRSRARMQAHFATARAQGKTAIRLTSRRATDAYVRGLCLEHQRNSEA